MPAGAPINATMSGTVATGFDANGYGNYIIITSGAKETLYGHCSKLIAKNGQKVNKGDIIAEVGTTGRSTGNHLHLRYTKDSKSLNPAFYIETK
jgi:murein DD-endopeptidase MepM/ murein hydrolase activator NlpD